MLIAHFDGQRVRAEKAGRGALGRCPWTGLPVVARVGAIRQFWAYEGGQPKFQSGYEPETEWHLSWKELVRDEFCEVVLGENREHRADILGANNTIIEIQRSVIDIRDSRERVRFYQETTGRRVVWIVDIQEFWQKRFKLSSSVDKSGTYLVDWRPRRAWLWDLAATTDTHLFLEFNQCSELLLHSWVFNGNLYAKFLSKERFFGKYLAEVAQQKYSAFGNEARQVLGISSSK